MADDKSRKGAQDRSRINVNEDYELRHWTQVLGISEEKLRDLVKRHGTSAETIRQVLGH